MEYKNSGYDISIDGVVRNKRGKTLKQYKNNLFKYYSISIRIDGKIKGVYIHRMIAETFIPNPLNLPQVNHKNGIKTDNRVENLEWVSVSDNVKHSYDNGLKKYKPLHYKGKFGAEHNRSKAIKCIETGVVYGSISEAARMLGKKVSTIHYNIGKKYLYV